MGKPDLLLLVHRIPYPPDKGDKIRSWHLFRHLTENWNVHLGCFVDDPSDLQHKNVLEKYAASCAFVPVSPLWSKIKSLHGFLSRQPLSFAWYASQEMRAYVEQVRAAYIVKAEMAFSSAMAPFLFNSTGEAPVIIDFCDSDAEKWRAYAQKSKGPMRMIYQREATLLAEEESRIANASAASFAITPEEACLFNKRNDMQNPVGVWGNGVDTHYFDPALEYAPPVPETADIVFTGAMDYQPNVDAVNWFCAEVWPRLRQKFPALSFAIVGSKPVESVEVLGRLEGVQVTGRVEDIRPWLHHARLVVAPLQIARGVQNKVLEAMAMGKPVVATKAAATGIAVIDEEHLLISDEAAGMTRHIITLLKDKTLCTSLGESARSFVITHHNWATMLRPLDEALAGLMLKD